LLVTGANDFTIQNGLVGNTASGGREQIIHQFGTGTLTISATVGVSTNIMSVTKDGPGTLVFTAANPYTGTTTINGGVFRANDGTGLPTTSPLVLNNGVFETSAATFIRTLGSAGGNVQITGGASGFSANGGAVTVTLGGVGSPTALTWGTTNFNPGILVLNESTANNTLDFKNAIDLNGSTRTINVNAASANTATVSGVIGSSIPGGALVKGGAGTLILSNINTYNGATTISGGEVVVSGSLNGTTAVNVASGATLASGATGGAITTGAVSGNSVDVAGTLSPGDTALAPITLTLSAGTKLNFESGSVLRLDVAPNGSSDSVIFGGSAGDWLSGSGNATLSLHGVINYSSTYVVFQNVSTPGFAFAGVTGYDSSNWTPTFAMSGNDYVLSFAAIPEPGSAVSLAGGVAMLLGLQKRRRRK
jgi:autotransporter-associated beta strand protein